MWFVIPQNDILLFFLSYIFFRAFKVFRSRQGNAKLKYPRLTHHFGVPVSFQQHLYIYACMLNIFSG